MTQALVLSEKSTTGRDVATRWGRAQVALAAWVSTGLAARTAVRLFATPARSRERQEWEHALLAKARAFRVHGLAAWRWGGGPPVVLAHGWEGHGSQLGAFVEPLVARGFSVVTFDAPAHGASPGAIATLRDFADALRSVGDRVGAPAAVIGHSFGALATLMAIKDGLPASAIAMIAAPSPKVYVQRFASALELSPRIAEEMRGRFEHRVGRTFDEVEGTALASGVSVPSLVVHDRNDKEVPWQLSERLAQSWPSATLEITERLGHRRILKDAGVIAKVTEFVGAHASPHAA